MSSESLIEKIREKKRIIAPIPILIIVGSIIFQSLDNSAKGNDYNNISSRRQELELPSSIDYERRGNIFTYDPDSLGKSQEPASKQRCVVIGEDARSLFDAWRKLNYPKGKRGEVVVIYKREGYPEIGIADNDGDRNNQPDIIPEVKRKFVGPKKGDIMCSLK